MSKNATTSEFPIQTFATANDFEKFLEREHTTAPGLYLKFAKKGSGIPSITGAEAIEVALCFGWIDGRANGIDDKWWTVRYTPRRAKSVWSQKNVKTVARLLDEGRMRPAGIAAVEAAKNDGRWERAYAGPATIVVPDDFTKVLAQNAKATKTFEGMDKVNRYAVLWRIETASPNSRAKRIESLVQMLAEGKLIHEQTKPAVKRKAKEEPEKIVPVKVQAKPELKGSSEEKKQTTKNHMQAGLPRRDGLRPR